MRKFLQKFRPLYRRIRSMGNSRLLAGSSYFDEQWYRSQYDQHLGQQSGIAHYLHEGAKLGFDPGPYFSTRSYIEDNPDVARMGINPLVHFLRYGQFEGRMPRATHAALGLDEALWSGCADEETTCLELRSIIDDSNAPTAEQIYAAWTLARWYAAHGSWSALQELLPVLYNADSRYAFLRVLPLVEVDGMTRAGLIREAEIRLNQLLKNSSDHFDLYLAKANVLAIQGNREIERLACINDIFHANNLVPLTLKNAREDLSMDNLQELLPDARVAHNDSQPLVSVLVPAFNSADTLATALDSLARQSWSTLEVLIIDDASTDDTLAVAEAFAEHDGRFKVLRRPYCEGAYAARNFGLNKAKGEFITVHDADDWSHPEKIEKQVWHLLMHPELMACTSHWVRCSDRLEFSAWRIETGWVERNISSLMYRRKVFEELGYWDRVKAAADTEFYFRLIQVYGERALAEVLPGVPLAFGRAAANSLTGSTETHIRTSLSGVRKTYLDAAHRWHHEKKNARSLYMQEQSETRAYPIPPAMRVDVKVLEGAVKLNPEAKTFLIVAHSASAQIFGAERSLLDVIAVLKDLGANVLVAIPEFGAQDYRDRLSHHTCKIFVLPYDWWRQGRNASASVRANFQHLIRRFSVDVLYCNTCVLWEPLQAARICSVKTVIHVHELPAYDPVLCKLLDADPGAIKQHVLSLADQLVVPSLAVAAWLDAPERTTVAPNVAGSELFALPARSGGFCVALISSNLPKKGLTDFVEMARCLADAGAKDISCLFIGPDNGYINELKQQQAQGEVPDNMRFPGMARNPADAIAQADVVVNLSHVQESFGRTVLEAMAGGRPVVCYDWGALSELVIDGETGYLVPFGDTRSVAQRVMELFHNPGLRTAISEAGRKRAEMHFGKERLMEKLAYFIDLEKSEY
jgi:glycosyltransferase involved in cell wall biosynthesis